MGSKKQTARVVMDIENWQIAEEMIRRGARPPIVLAATNLSRDALRDLWQKIHNTRPPCGQLPLSTLTMIRRLRQAAHASLFFRCYESVGGKEIYFSVDTRKVLRAHDLYRNMVGGKNKEEIDFTFAWFLAQDIKIRNLERKYCTTCQIDYLYSPQLKILHGCPYCRVYKHLANGRSKKQEEDAS